MKNAIVTGASGYIGQWLVKELLNNDIKVVAVVRENSDIQNLPKSDKLSIVKCSMSDYDKLDTLINIEKDSVFYHLAWDGVCGDKRKDARVQMENVYGCQNAVEAAAKLSCAKFVGLGSIMERETIAATVSNGVKPGMAYIYGDAKHSAHLISKATAAELNLPHIWVTLTNPYGEYDNSNRFINATLHKILNDEPLEFTQGLQMYDFIYIGDAVKAIRLLGENGKPYYDYLVGSGKPRKLREFIEEIGKTLAPNATLNFGNIPYTGAEMTAEDYSIEQLVEDTGFIPEISFSDGIARTMNWIRNTYK